MKHVKQHISRPRDPHLQVSKLRAYTLAANAVKFDTKLSAEEKDEQLRKLSEAYDI